MLTLIGNIFKYSLLVLTILVLSHVIEIKGVSISQHVQNGMNWVTGFNPTREVNHVTREISSTVSNVTGNLAAFKNHHVDEANKALDADITPQDQNQLNRVITTSEHHR
jgi:hypothetical protein